MIHRRVNPGVNWALPTLILLNGFTYAAAAARDTEPVNEPDKALYSIYCDAQTGLCWQDPQKDAYKPADPGLVATEAARYCDELVLGGYDDWRLPDSDELRALIAGNEATEPGGQCMLTIGGGRNETLFRACEGGQPGKGPGANGCYLRPGLTGTCNKTGPPQATQYLEIWASNRPADDADGWQAYVSFDRGALGYNHVNSAGDVRCVREGRGANQTGLAPANRFVARAPEAADLDPCEVSDKLALHIRVPDKLANPPDRLMAFLYRADKWRFPPAGPPDGGTDYNTVMQPEFSADGEFRTVLPGCTFYREHTLEGEYRVYVQLLMEERRPPMVMQGDYYWGSNTEVFELPFDGIEHRGTQQNLELTLWPVVR
ncbi:MAG: DUF1566 domain-containing protein [Gammaproteobacteria bacterium]|nr:DUF1566 domain-containing protein [Gammaproteobacteria bacterium]MDP7042109.1 DUF1566 domain-containing protein [Gammaproteobacteria bacterium]